MILSSRQLEGAVNASVVTTSIYSLYRYYRSDYPLRSYFLVLDTAPNVNKQDRT